MEQKRRVLSWDVGIKHFPYCIIEKDNLTGKFQIIKWDMINLVEEEMHTCCGKMKNGKECGKKASLIGKHTDGSMKSFCKTHKEEFKPLPENLETLVQKQNDTGECSFIYPKKGDACCKKAQNIVQGKLYCNAHKTHFLQVLKKDHALRSIKTKKCTSTDPQLLSSRLYNILDLIPEVLQVNEVLIENQPTFKNPVMKAVSSMLFSYFVLRGVIDKEKTGSCITNVRFVSPLNKLKVDDAKTKEILGAAKNDEEKYELTKNLGLEYTKILLKNENEWLTHLNNYKKKDDMCDSFLQGYYYLFKTKTITT